MDKQKNKGLIITVIILAVLVVTLGGYIIYDKIIPNENAKTDIKNSNKDNSNDKIKNEIEKTISEDEALSIVNEL